MPEREARKAGAVVAAGLFLLTGLYVLAKLLEPKRESQVYYCPQCGHIVSYKAPYCWHCRIPLEWESSPPKAKLSRGVSWIFLGILLFLVLMRFGVYPFISVPQETLTACDRAIWFFGGIFVRDFGGYLGRNFKS